MPKHGSRDCIMRSGKPEELHMDPEWRRRMSNSMGEEELILRSVRPRWLKHVTIPYVDNGWKSKGHFDR